MATNRNQFEKRERDRAKRAKALAKREKRLESEKAAAEAGTDGDVVDPSQILEQVAALHEQFDAGDIKFDEFEERKAELMSQLTVD